MGSATSTSERGTAIKVAVVGGGSSDTSVRAEPSSDTTSPTSVGGGGSAIKVAVVVVGGGIKLRSLTLTTLLGLLRKEEKVRFR